MSLVQTAKDSLSSLFENLEDTPFCARCLLGASQKGIMEAQLAVGFKEFWAAITQDLRFWKSFMRFLFTPRTDSQTRTFLEQISHCSCRMSDRKIRGYHRFGRFLEQDLLARTCVDIQTSPIAFITNLFRTLTGALEGAHLKAVAKRMAVNWPTCPEDLMPFGPDKLIESIIMWSRFIPDIIVFRVASQCIRFCGALLIPSVIESGLTRHVVDAGRQLFDRTLTTLRLRAETRRKEMGHAFACQSEALLEYFIDFCEDQPIEKRMILYEKYELKATQIFAMLAYLADDPRLFVENRQSSTARLAYQAVGVYRALRHYIDPLPSLRLFPVVWDIVYDREEVEKEREEEHKEMLLLDAKQDPNLSVFDPGYEVPQSFYDRIAKNTLFHIRNSRFDLRCSARFCPNSIQSTGRQFQRCGRCNIAVYCCKTCQIDAWTAEHFPHKLICKLLRKIVRVAGADVVFRCPMPHHSYYPEDLGLSVLASWRTNKVPIADLLQVAGWASYRVYPSIITMRSKCEPGYADYEELITELSGREGGTEALFLEVEKPMSSERYDELRLTFDSISKMALTPHSTSRM